MELEGKLSDPKADEERAGAAEQRDEAHEEIQPQEEEQPQHDVKTEEELVKQVNEQNEQQFPETLSVDQGHRQGPPVHQGQPEM